MRNVLFLILVFYVLVLLQTSFFVSFNIFGIVPNLVIIAVIFINFFEKPDKKFGIICGFFGGFFIDIFSGNFFGFYTIILLAVSLFLKYFLKRHVRLWT
jgi:rod shape-determining protein MreD